jgi:D-alanyl-D-alanine carboxypeptidase/D-alanyl-D-alanine-endopeptidase (penicillin-binding protein 4)
MILPVLFLSIQSACDRIFNNAKLDGATVAMTVTDLTGSTLYDHNGSVHVVPASNQKLLSSAFALWELGLDYRPKTSFWKMRDRLIVDSNGDPLMTYAKLKSIQTQLGTRRDIPVYVRESYAPQIPDGWNYDDLPNKYAAPVCAFTFDRGSFALWSKRRRPALVPEAFGVKMHFHPSNESLETHYNPITRRATVSGRMPREDRVLDTLALPKPDEAAASILGRGFHPISEVPSTAPDLVVEGQSSLDIVAACLPPSDNNLAENLLLLGAQKEGDLGPRPYPVACKRLVDFLSHVVGIDRDDVHPFDGSGLSRHDYLTTRALAKLLVWGNTQPIGPAWRKAMVHSGNGTLGNRLKNIKFDGKTGSMDKVSSLSGYVTTASGKTLIVSMVMNQFSCSAAEVHAIQDSVVTYLAEN